MKQTNLLALCSLASWHAATRENAMPLDDPAFAIPKHDMPPHHARTTSGRSRIPARLTMNLFIIIHLHIHQCWRCVVHIMFPPCKTFLLLQLAGQN